MPRRTEIESRLETTRVAVGDYLEFPGPYGKIKVTVARLAHERVHPDSPHSRDIDCVELRIDGVGWPTCGHEARALASRVFLVPLEAVSPAGSVFNLVTGGRDFAIYAVRVTHVNFRREEAELEVFTAGV